MWIYDALYQECNKTLWLPCKLEFSPPSRLASIISDGQKIAEMKEFNAMYLVPGVPFSFAKLKVMLANEEGHSSPSNAPHLIGAPPNSVKCKSNLNSQSSISQNSKNTNGIIGKNLLNNRYQIMYTVDKQKKTKIWHDGTAEYKPISEEWIFLDQDNKNIHRRKTSPTLESVEEGLIIDSARFLIEVGAPILGKSKRSSNVDDTEPVDVQSSTEMDPDLHLKPKKEVEEIKFPFLYTTQKTQKAKKWKDGVVNWNTSTLTAVFNDEDRRPIHRRTFSSTAEITDGIEFSTAKYLIEVEKNVVKIPATAFEIKSSWEISSSPQAQDNDPYQGSRPLKTSNLIDRKRVASSAFPPAKHLAKNSNTFKTEIMSGDTINSDFQEDLVKEKVVCLNGVSKVKKPASTQSLLERLRAANKTT